MSEHSPLIVGRFMDAEQQQDLAQKVVNATGVSLEELPLGLLAAGQAYMPLIDEERYRDALDQPGGELKHLSDDESQGILAEQIRQHPTASKTLTVEVDKTAKRSRSRLTVISYRFTLPEAEREYQGFGRTIDELNGTTTEWKPLYPKLILAVMPMGDRRTKMLAGAFKAARPADVILTGARVIKASELNQPAAETVEA